MIDVSTIKDGLQIGHCSGWDCEICPVNDEMLNKRCCIVSNDKRSLPGIDYPFRPRVIRLLTAWVEYQEARK